MGLRKTTPNYFWVKLFFIWFILLSYIDNLPFCISLILSMGSTICYWDQSTSSHGKCELFVVFLFDLYCWARHLMFMELYGLLKEEYLKNRTGGKTGFAFGSWFFLVFDQFLLVSGIFFLTKLVIGSQFNQLDWSIWSSFYNHGLKRYLSPYRSTHFDYW